MGLSGAGGLVRKTECEGTAGAGTMGRRAGWRGWGEQCGGGMGTTAERGRRAGKMRADVTGERDGGRDWGVVGYLGNLVGGRGIGKVVG